MKIISTRFAAFLMVISALWACSKNGEPELPFPETEEEKIESMKKMIAIDAAARPMIRQAFEDAAGKKVNVKSLVKKLRKIDGVASVEIVDSEDIILIEQNDGVYINVVLDSFKKESEQYDNGFSLRDAVDVLSKSREMINEEEAVVNNGKRALYLALNYDETMRVFDDPVYNWEGSDYAKQLYDERYQMLEQLGYQIDSFLNSNVSIDRFRGDILQQYDLIFVHSHGGNNFTLADGVSRSTVIKTATRIDSGLPYSSDLRLQAFAMYDGGTHYMFTSPLLLADNPSFDDTWIFMQACHSYEDDDLADAFFQCHAAGYSGFSDTVWKRDGLILINNLLKYFGRGNEADESFVLARDNSVFSDGSPVGQSNIFRSEKNPDLTDIPYYIVNSTPFNLLSSPKSSVPVSNEFDLSWEMNPSLSDYTYELFINNKSVFEGSLSGDGNKYTYKHIQDGVGLNEWYVVSSFTESDSGMTYSFKSDVKPFTVKESLSLYPELIKFGRVGSADGVLWRQREFSIVNIGQRDARVWVESCPQDYFVSISGVITIPKGTTYPGVVTFNPWDEKVCNGTIVIKSDVGATLSLEVQAEGYYNGATVGYDVDEVVFDRVPPGQSDTKTIQLKNVGKNSSILYSKDMRFTGDNCFSVTMPEYVDLGAGETADIHITFHPSVVGDYESSLSLTFSEKEYYVALPIRGKCLEYEGLSFNKPVLEFGEVGVGDSVTQPLDVTNDWKTAVSFSLVYEDWIGTERRDYTLAAGETKTIDFVFTPKTAKSYDGTIMFVLEDGSRQRIHYTGEGIIPPKTITLNKSELDMIVGEKYQLVATVKPDNATNKNVKWQSAKASVVTVDQTGVVTAVGKGENALVFATTEYGGLIATCYVSVRDSVNGNHEGTNDEYWN